MKDHYLLPFLLPNVFEICKSVSTEEFAAVLPKLQPLFALKDSPQNLIGGSTSWDLPMASDRGPALLDSLSLFKEKTTSQQFKDGMCAAPPCFFADIEQTSCL